MGNMLFQSIVALLIALAGLCFAAYLWVTKDGTHALGALMTCTYIAAWVAPPAERVRAFVAFCKAKEE
jgi:hypothetical protein